MKKRQIVFLGTLFTISLIVFFNVPKVGNREEGSVYKEPISEKKKTIKSRSQSPTGFVEYFNRIATREGQEYLPNYRFKEFNKALNSSVASSSRKTSTITAVTSRGPGNVGGRTRAIVIDPDDNTNSTWLAGSSSGGIWKTTDKGKSWENMTPDLPNLSTNSMAMAPSNHDVIYAGTGEIFAGNTSFVRGNGIFKSTQRGILGSWTQLISTVNDRTFESVNRIIVDPNSEDVVVICTNTGIYKSIDGGATWDEKLSSNTEIQDLKYVSGDFSIQFAALNSIGIYKSTDGGDTWDNSSQGIGSGERFELAVAPSDVNILYASTYNSNDETIIYRSKDQGASWLLLDFAEDAEDDGNYLGEQGWYDNAIAVNPYDPDEIYVGGVYIGKYSVTGPEAVSEASFLGVDLESVNFLSFVNFSQNFFGGALAIGDGDDASSEFFNVEIRFGAGLTQKAHRFTVPEDGGSTNNGGAGVPDGDYAYQDYIDVPFEVWDTDSDRQLMISFRDNQRDGGFNLNVRDDANDPDLLTAREYLFISNITYAESASSDITTAGGHLSKNMYFFWPILADGETWDSSNLPTGLMRIKYGSLSTIEAFPTIVSDPRGTYGGKSNNLHADHHNLTIIPTDVQNEEFIIVNGNDGGLGISEDKGESWEQLLDGYITTQFYGADKKPKEQVYFGGMQDNGSWRSEDEEDASVTSEYTEMIGGDGFEVIWHAQDPDKLIGGSQNGGFRRSITGGATRSEWTDATNGLDDDSPFISRLSSSRTHPDVVFAIQNTGVAKSRSFGDNWSLTPISVEEGWTNANNDGPIAYSSFDVEVSLSNHNIVWAGAAMFRESLKVFVSADEGKSFSAVPSYEGGSDFISGIATHPFEDSTAYILFSFPESTKIIRTKDLGQTWEDISGFEGNTESDNGFPDVIVHSLLVLPQSPETLWAGTEIGLFQSTDDGETWSYADIGLPAVSIWSMKVVDDEVVLGTHGRGIWTVTMSDLLVSQSLIGEADYQGSLKVSLDVDYTADFDKVDLYLDKTVVKTFTNVTAGSEEIEIDLDPTDKESIEIYMVTTSGDQSYRSAKQFIEPEFEPTLFSVKPGGADPSQVDVVLILDELYDELEIVLNDKVVKSLGAITETGELKVSIDVEESGQQEVYAVGYLGDFSFESSTKKTTVSVLSIQDLANRFEIYPNPASNLVNVNLNDESLKIQELELFNLSGMKVRSWSVLKQNMTIDLSAFETGVYLLKVRTVEGSFTSRIIKL
ncbi:MAG: T9SS type A sorting domain-containing protein [Cyclobacteriaceae bacterium]